MPFYKCVLQFIQFKAEWKELYYMTADDLRSATARFDDNFRAAAEDWRASGTYMASVRVSEVDKNRNANLVIFTIPSNVVDTLAPDPVQTAALWSLRSTLVWQKSNKWFRGLIDSDVLRNATTGQDTPSADLKTNVGNYIQQLHDTGLQLRSLSLIDPVTNPFVTISVITVQMGGVTTITTQAPVVFPAGPKRVILSQLDPKMWPGLSGTFTALNISGANFDVKYRADQPAASYPIIKGKVRTVSYDYGTIAPDSCMFNRFAKRDTKNGPSGGRGAKRAVRLRSL